MRQLWKQIPDFFKWHMVLVLAFALAPVFMVNVGAQEGFQRIAFAIPAPEHMAQPWQNEVDAFGQQVSAAFGVRRSTANEFAVWILEASLRQGLEPELLASLVHTESTFRKEALSPVGAIGPAQVRPVFWSGFCGSSDLQDPAENIYCGAQVLSHLRDRCGDDRCALKWYNIGMYSEQVQAAQRYIAKIDWARDQLKNHAL